MSYFDIEFMPKLGARGTTFRAVIREALASFASPNIVETGSMRMDNNWEGDGQSTLIWNSLVYFMKGEVTTIDIDQRAIDLVKERCPSVKTQCSDGVLTIRGMVSPIDILYLDSLDLDVKNPHPAAMQALGELTSAIPLLKPGSIVFVDDAPWQNGDIGGKGAYIAQYMKAINVPLITFGYQAAWKLP